MYVNFKNTHHKKVMKRRGMKGKGIKPGDKFIWFLLAFLMGVLIFTALIARNLGRV